MRFLRRCVSFCLSILILFVSFLLLSPEANAASYEDGSYQVPLSAEGLGRHNIVWPQADVRIRNGEIFIDITFERVEPRDHAPLYDWLSTSCGTYEPVVDDEAFTCTFYDVQIEDFGEIAVKLQTSAMSQPYELEYTLYADGSAIPLKEEASAPSASAEESESSPVSKDESGAPGGGTIAAIAAAAAVLLCGAVYLIVRRKKKQSGGLL